MAPHSDGAAHQRHLLGTASVASAIYLILEFSQPYLGLFRISHEGIDQVIATLSANQPRCG